MRCVSTIINKHTDRPDPPLPPKIQHRAPCSPPPGSRRPRSDVRGSRRRARASSATAACGCRPARGASVGAGRRGGSADNKNATRAKLKIRRKSKHTCVNKNKQTATGWHTRPTAETTRGQTRTRGGEGSKTCLVKARWPKKCGQEKVA